MYLAPKTIEDAFEFLGASGGQDARIIAGCTDYLAGEAANQRETPVLDVTKIDGFRGISDTADGWRIGAATTWTDIVRAPLPPGFDALKQAALEVGSVQIQNRGTVGGNLCNASPAADGVPPLLVLDAQVELLSKSGTRHVPLADFITGVRQTVLMPGELVAAIHVPGKPGAGKSAFLKLGSRTHLVISIAMVAANLKLDEGQIAAARVAVGSCAPVARRLPELERALIGATSENVAAMGFASLPVWGNLAPIDDARGTATYRIDAVATLCQRAVLQAMG